MMILIMMNSNEKLFDFIEERNAKNKTRTNKAFLVYGDQEIQVELMNDYSVLKGLMLKCYDMDSIRAMIDEYLNTPTYRLEILCKDIHVQIPKVKLSACMSVHMSPDMCELSCRFQMLSDTDCTLWHIYSYK